MNVQSEATALTNLTIGGQSVLYELFRKQLDCADQAIRKLELTYFAASITTAIYLRLGKQPSREQILDVFAKDILKGSITASQEQISFGSAVAEYQAATPNMIGYWRWSLTATVHQPATQRSRCCFTCLNA
jgi:hypothetical protein